MFLLSRPKCVECRQFANIPYAKRGRRLVFVCMPCYLRLGFADFFFSKLLRSK